MLVLFFALYGPRAFDVLAVAGVVELVCGFWNGFVARLVPGRFESVFSSNALFRFWTLLAGAGAALFGGWKN